MTPTRDPLILARRRQLRRPAVRPAAEPVSVRLVREWRKYWGQEETANRATAGRN